MRSSRSIYGELTFVIIWYLSEARRIFSHKCALKQTGVIAPLPFLRHFSPVVPLHACVALHHAHRASRPPSQPW